MNCEKPWWHRPSAGFYKEVLLPCLSCIPCRVNLRRLWTTRLYLESLCHKRKGFLTLTFDDKNLPKDLSLDPNTSRLFWNKLRNHYPAGTIRYLLTGEYGGKLYGNPEAERSINPHYHAAVFGLSCEGPFYCGTTGNRCWCPTCERIRSVWGYGNITLDPLNMVTSRYIVGYIMKKMSKLGDPRLNGLYPEFKRQSRGLGKTAIPLISKALSQYLTESGDVPGILQIDGKMLPIGRYLHAQLRKEKSLFQTKTAPEKIHAARLYNEKVSAVFEAAKNHWKTFDVALDKIELMQPDYKGRALITSQRFNFERLKTL